MDITDDLIADSGPKTHVRDAVRPHLDFILASKKAGLSEAAIHRHLLKHGFAVGSRSGFGAALKFLLKEAKGGAIAHRSEKADGALVVPAPVEPVAAAASSASAPSHSETPDRPSAGSLFADDRVRPMFGGH